MNGAGGGAAMSTLGLISALEARGVHSSVVCHDMGDEAEREAILHAVHGAAVFTPLHWWNKKVRTPVWKRPLAAMRQSLRTGAGMASSAQVAAMALRDSCDLIHTNTIVTPEGARAASMLGLPHVWHVRELLGDGAPYQLPWKGEALGKVLARRASMIVANSAATARPLEAILPAPQLVVVDNGVDLARFTRRTERGNPPVVAMVGNLTSRWKKHALFLEAAAKIEADTPPELRFYGHFDEHDPYVVELRQKAVDLGIAARLRWMGHVDPAEIMRSIDILLHPTDQESFGRVIVEAMAAAVPVVGVDSGGVGELVISGETGLLAPVDDAAGLASCVTRLLADPKLARIFGSAGHDRAQARYSLDAHAEAMLEVYARAMTRPLGLLHPKERRA
jgi:glycosyltransferase involved in cell wall biosynthesis